MGILERKEREKEHRREEIIAAAQSIFLDKGLQLATMDEIAEAAELSKGTLYLYYKSKEDLYLAVVMRGVEIMYELFKRATSTGEPVMKLISNLGDAYFEFFKNNWQYFRMMYFRDNPRLHQQVSSEMLNVCLEQDRRVWKLVIDLIQRAIDEGYLQKNISPVQAGIILWSNSTGLMRQMDRGDNYWQEQMGVNLEETLRLSNALLLDAMMTEKAKQEYPSMVI
ncbi:MAG: TetR/AcrR family transcriptional regulator [Bacteroidota bacterium]|nr:TetR/AcrR family transcriptional regulator [Bacteroidota bacterium]